MPSLRDLQYAIPIGAQVVGGVLNRRAAGSAQNRIAQGGAEAIRTIQAGSADARRTMADVYRQQRETLTPYSTTGRSALPALEQGVAPGGDFNKPFDATTFDLYKDPSFQFRLQQGQEAIKAGANAGGIRFSGATLKALNDYAGEAASQEYGAAFGRHQQDVSGRFGRLRDVAGIGETAAGREVAAGSDYGFNLANLDQRTAESVADLQTQLATAQAQGDAARANAISDTISGIIGTVENVGTARALGNVAAPAAGVTMGAAAIPSLAGGAVPAIGAIPAVGPASMGVGGLSSIGGSTAATSTAAGGGGGMSAAVTGFLTNPITIGVGAAIIGITSLLKSQAHHEANSWVQGFQNPFDQKMDQLNREFHRAAQAGQLSAEQALQIRAAAEEAARGYQQKLAEFERRGSDERRVARQARATADQHYGPGFQNFLAGMDQVISQLAG